MDTKGEKWKDRQLERKIYRKTERNPKKQTDR